MSTAGPPRDPWQALAARTPARIALGRSGASLPTREVLAFALAHARARDAVWTPLEVGLLTGLAALGLSPIEVASEARVLSSALEQSASVHCTIRSENPMSLPPIVTLTMLVSAVTDPIWLDMRLAVVAPEQATNVSEVFARCWATSHGYA